MKELTPAPNKEEFFDLLHEAIGEPVDSEELRKSEQESESELDEN